MRVPKNIEKKILEKAGVKTCRATTFSKYRNRKQVVDGITFASKKEAKRYGELKILEKQGEIYDLETQTITSIYVNKQFICQYIADFTYIKTNDPLEIHVFEDVKSPITRKNPVYRLKKKLMAAVHNINIVEI